MYIDIRYLPAVGYALSGYSLFARCKFTIAHKVICEKIRNRACHTRFKNHGLEAYRRGGPISA